MSSFSSTAPLQSCWATRRHPHRWFSPTWLCPVSWFFSLLAFPTQWHPLCQRSPCLVLGVNSVLLREGGRGTALCSSCILSTYRALKTTAPQNRHNSTGSAHPQVLLMALATCRPSLMPCFVASWSGPVAPRCFCTDTARGRSILTPPLRIFAPQMHPGDQSHPHHPDAGGHLCHCVHAEFHVFFLYCFLLKYSSVVDRDLSSFGCMFPHF